MLFFARQAGSARSLTPVIAEVLSGVSDRSSVLVLASNQAAEVWSEAGLLDSEVGSFADAREMLGGVEDPTLVVTGTSIEAEDDGAYWDWARERGVPSIAYVDSRVNYAERFDGFRFLPDHIAVIDHHVLEQLRDLGAPPSSLRVVGNPAFDALAHLAQESEVDPEALLWVGEGIATVMWPGGVRPEGLAHIDEEAIFKGLVESLQGLSPVDRPARLWIAPHPREDVATYESWLVGADLASTEVSFVHGGGTQWAARAGAVVGMNSMLLVEAAQMGVPTMSLQFHEGPVGEVIRDRPGIAVVRSKEALVVALTGRLGRPQRGPVIACDDTRRFLEFMSQVGGSFGGGR